MIGKTSTVKLEERGLKWEEEATLEVLRALVNSLATTSSVYIISTMNRLTQDKDVRAHMNEGMLNYLYAAALLSLAGREITKDNMAKILKVLGVESNTKFMDVLLKKGLKGHVVYIYAYYFILASGHEITIDKMMATVTALGVKPDRDIAKEMLEFCKGGVR